MFDVGPNRSFPGGKGLAVDTDKNRFISVLFTSFYSNS